MNNQLVQKIWSNELIKRKSLDIVVIGMGPVGIKVIKELIKKDPHCRITAFGDEPWEPYNRVQLSTLLQGQTNIYDINNALDRRLYQTVVQHHNCPVISINRQERSIKDADGEITHYQKLILAVGSKPRIPYLKGIYLNGVYTFQDLRDVENLIARRIHSRTTVVVGGGLLGLEVAKAMQRDNTQVYILDHSVRLMFNQLDDKASSLLFEHVLSLGIKVILSNSVKTLQGDNTVNNVELLSGRTIPCDTVIFATGIQPNISLAKNCNLHVGRGIKVNNRMQTNDPDIYAVGECCEHNGKTYGFVEPGLEQASIAAHHITKNKSIRYRGSVAATHLKVFDYAVFSMGEVAEKENPIDHRSIIYESNSNFIYRKLVLKNGKLVGAIATGRWEQTSQLRESIYKHKRLWPWERARFIRTGQIWQQHKGRNVISWSQVIRKKFGKVCV